MSLRSFALFFLTFAQTASAQPLNAGEYTRLINGGLDFLHSEQVDESIGELEWEGEFPSYMENEKFVIALGRKGKRHYDSNCFSTALIYEELARNVDQLKDHPHYAQMMNRAYRNILTFKNGDGYNFWHALPMNALMKKHSKKKYWSLYTFRPNIYPLHNRFAQVRANIANDADDTSLAELAVLNQKKLSQLSSVFVAPEEESSKLADQVSSFRDTPDRKWRYPTNVIYGNFQKTGAFLTWLVKEQTAFIYSPFKSWGDSLRIPEGVNNLDCVVNANVLSSLSAHGLQNTPGVKEACAYIESAVNSKLEDKCGLYYPNPYTLHYAVGKAYKNGAQCLKKSAEILLSRLMKEQQKDGSWKGGLFEEPVQSSLYATRALMDLGKELNRMSETSSFQDRAVQYIYSQKIEDEDGIYWPEGTFFSGGGFVRRSLSWKSESYSTALAMSIFSDLLREQK